MMDDLKDFAADLAPVPEAPPEGAEALVAPVAALVAEPTPEAAPAAPVAEPAPTQQQAEGRGYAPLDVVLSEREKRQAAERRVAELEAQIQPNHPPSIQDDPEGYEAYLAEQMDARERNIRFDMSERFATQAHGAETVTTAKEWALTQDPYWRARALAQPDPIGWIVTEYRKDLTVSQLGSQSLEEAHRAYAISQGWLQADGSPAPAPVAAAPPAPKAPAPPRSLVGQPSSGGSAQQIPMHSLAALEALPLKG